VTQGQCDARPTVTFPAIEQHCPLAGTSLYCLLNRGTLCVNNLPIVVREVEWPWLELRLIGCKFNALTTTRKEIVYYTCWLCQSAWVGHSRPSVCLSVCLQHNLKTNDPEVFRRWREWPWDVLEVTWFGDWKVKGQGHRINNTTQWDFISNYNHASFTFARWR